MHFDRMSLFAFIALNACLLIANIPAARGKEPILSRENVCHFYGQAGQGAQAWNKDESCIIPRLEYLDTSYHQSDFVCCGGGGALTTTNRDMPPGIEVVVAGRQYWSVRVLRLHENQFLLDTPSSEHPERVQ